MKTENLRVLIANEDETSLRLVASLVASLGHDAIARAVDAQDVGVVARTERPDIALVALGASSVQALEVVESLSREAVCGVIVLLRRSDPEFVKEAAKRGAFAYIADGDPRSLQGSIEIVFRRFADYQDLKRAFERRAMTERAKGILMERHGIDEARAFELLRGSARRRNRKLIDVATAVVEGHPLLPKQSTPTTLSPGTGNGTGDQSARRIDCLHPELDHGPGRGAGIAARRAAAGQ